MKHISSISICRSFLLFCLFIPLGLQGQSDPWSGWDQDVISSLNIASETGYLNGEEKKVILFMNMARYDGALFARTFLESYIVEKKLDNSSYIRSLRKELTRLPRLELLIPERDLTSIAKDHATKSGEKGTTGHTGFKDRFQPFMGNPYNHVGENCSYGYGKAIDIVISLLIDEGIKDLGHRKNILSPDFNSIGVAIRFHKTYRFNCVMDFGSRDRSGMNEVPF